ncbi:MAG: thioredoxin family protein [Anaerolineae bacterium]|nr:thioredoxin family protein [Anaerolineae bacterium]
MLHIRVLHSPGCASTPKAMENLRQVLEELGVQAEIQEIVMEADMDPAEWRYFGSPTIRINGADVDPYAEKRTDYSGG